MKTTLALLLVIGSFSSVAAADKADAIIPPGLINMAGADPVQILDYYQTLSGKKLVTSSHVRGLRTKITVQPDVALKVSEALTLIEAALREQAGIVVTKIDEQRVSVTYNDALPLTVIRNPKPFPLPVDKDGKPITPPTFSPEPVPK
jgi:hypothetical protein